MHPVIQKAIHVKWKFYGKWDTIWKLLITFFYSIAWLVLAYHFPDERTYYTPWKSNGWKILFEVLIIVFALYFLIEVSVFSKHVLLEPNTKKQLKKFWKLRQVCILFLANQSNNFSTVEDDLFNNFYELSFNIVGFI